MECIWYQWSCIGPFFILPWNSDGAVICITALCTLNGCIWMLCSKANNKNKSMHLIERKNCAGKWRGKRFFMRDNCFFPVRVSTTILFSRIIIKTTTRIILQIDVETQRNKFFIDLSTAYTQFHRIMSPLVGTSVSKFNFSFVFTNFFLPFFNFIAFRSSYFRIQYDVPYTCWVEETWIAKRKSSFPFFFLFFKMKLWSFFFFCYFSRWFLLATDNWDVLSFDGLFGYGNCIIHITRGSVLNFFKKFLTRVKKVLGKTWVVDFHENVQTQRKKSLESRWKRNEGDWEKKFLKSEFFLKLLILEHFPEFQKNGEKNLTGKISK